MILMIEGHDFHYEMENLCRIFFPYKKIKTVRERVEPEEITAYTGVFERGDEVDLRVWLKIGDQCKEAEQTVAASQAHQDKECERLLAVLLYGLFTDLCGYTPK